MDSIFNRVSSLFTSSTLSGTGNTSNVSSAPSAPISSPPSDNIQSSLSSAPSSNFTPPQAPSTNTPSSQATQTSTPSAPSLSSQPSSHVSSHSSQPSSQPSSSAPPPPLPFCLRGSHSYSVTTNLGQVDPEVAFESLLQNATPLAPPTPVTDGSTTSIPILGTVVHSVNTQSRSVTNTAQPDHLLYPGTVTRTVEQDSSGNVSIQTTGTGDGILPSANNALAPIVWAIPDSNIRHDTQTSDSQQS